MKLSLDYLFSITSHPIEALSKTNYFCSNLRKISMQRDIASIKDQVKENTSLYTKLRESLEQQMNVLDGELHVANSKIDTFQVELKKQQEMVDDTYDRSLKQYSRDNNERFYNVLETVGEDYTTFWNL